MLEAEPLRMLLLTPGAGDENRTCMTSWERWTRAALLARSHLRPTAGPGDLLKLTQVDPPHGGLLGAAARPAPNVVALRGTCSGRC